MSTDQAGRTTVEVEAVLFDMDGTLVDSTAVVEDVWARFATRHGVVLADVLAYSHGRQTKDTLLRFLPPGHDVDAVAEEIEREETTRTDGITEIPGARRLLELLRGARTAVVTSASRPLAEARLLAAGLPVPEVLVAAEDVAAGKPDPSGYVAAAKRLGVAPDRCLVLEDAEAGILAGLASGAHTLVVGSHLSPATRHLDRVPDLRPVGADPAAHGGARLHWPHHPTP
ncbi:HAD-IA family hydrolase [Nocardiopsis changdeensis]|uniref:HAD-IA family hydrolase n=1 Tax=Nocardiopsis changdeensis TaxID=2831969 RepID=A0ABX8BI55_9ACTN|nr:MULTISPECIES: HAD-IA family hydrolase [Nocardiopsis]QUX20518.1 HAD-IA family hydrolase [Nocardiopsis changdeensis]QYX36449.1 HAD-IA family hydrolase [Nocardiopsis sp. MT53]